MAADLTELTLQRERVERRLSVQYAVTRVLADADNLGLATPGILESVCTIMGWAFGSVWAVDDHGSRLHCVGVWHAPGTEFPQFEKETRESLFSMGEDLGRVWNTLAPARVPDVLHESNLPRALAASSEGLNGAFAFPVQSEGEILAVIEFFSQEIREPDEPLLQMLAALGNQIAIFIKRRRAEDALRLKNAQLEAQNQAQQLLIQASSELDASLDFDTTLKNVAHLAIPYLADWCAIFLVEDDGSIRRVATAHENPEKSKLLEEFQRRYAIDPASRHPVAEVIRTGVSQLSPVVPEERMLSAAPDRDHMDMVRTLGMASTMIVALRARGRTIGAISLISGSPGRRYGDADMRLAEDLARRAALAVDNSRLFQQTQEALALRDEFLAAASHDLKGPLATIKGLAQLLHRFLEREPIDKQRIGDGLTSIDASTNKMTSLINQLLDVSRVEMGHPLELDLKPTDLVSLTERTLTDQGLAADRRRIVFEATQPKLVGIWDPERIQRVVTNLVSNAVKYSPSNSKIIVRVRPTRREESESSAALLQISDRGIGIPAAEIPRIFDHFHRARNVRDRVRGSGIGLASVRQIVTQHGGQVLVDSEEGRGSTFTVILPIEPPTTESSQ